MAELVTTSAVKISVKPTDVAKLEALPTYDSAKVTDKGTGKDAVKELALTKSASPKLGKYWRLVYHPKTLEALMLYESEGQTVTPWNMFCGTKEECLGEITKLKLKTEKIAKEKLEGLKDDGGVEIKPNEEPIDPIKEIKPK